MRGVNVKDAGIGAVGRLGPVEGFEDHREAEQRVEVVGVERQCPTQVRQGEAELLLPIIGGGATMPAFGEFRRMIDERREMSDSSVDLPGFQRVLPAGQQQIHRRGSRAQPVERDLTLDLAGL